MTGKLHNRQTLIDVAVQNCGSADALIQLAFINGVGITDDVLPGTSLTLPDMIDAGVVKKLKPFGNVPVSGIELNPPAPEGIGYWYIEQDFIVQ